MFLWLYIVKQKAYTHTQYIEKVTDIEYISFIAPSEPKD